MQVRNGAVVDNPVNSLNTIQMVIPERGSHMKKWLIAAWLLATALGLPAFAQFDCTDCHGTDGEPAVNVPVFEESVHGFLSCTDCHVGADENMDDHPFNLEPVSCADCHPTGITGDGGCE